MPHMLNLSFNFENLLLFEVVVIVVIAVVCYPVLWMCVNCWESEYVFLYEDPMTAYELIRIPSIK